MKINSIQFAGHSAVFLHADNYTIALDPWLEGNPSCPTACKNPAKLDLIVLSHGHSDHAGDVLRLAAKYNCKIAATFELCSLLAKAGVASDSLLFMNKGGSLEHEGFKISLCNAQHSSSYDIEGNTFYAGEACGIIIKDEVQAFYHAGDTALFSDMALIAKNHQPKYCFLPIGDRFTMGPQDAAIAVNLINADYCIPIHHSTFPQLSGTVDTFLNFCKDSATKVLPLKAGETYKI